MFRYEFTVQLPLPDDVQHNLKPPSRAALPSGTLVRTGDGSPVTAAHAAFAVTARGGHGEALRERKGAMLVLQRKAAAARLRVAPALPGAPRGAPKTKNPSPARRGGEGSGQAAAINQRPGKRAGAKARPRCWPGAAAFPRRPPAGPAMRAAPAGAPRRGGTGRAPRVAPGRAPRWSLGAAGPARPWGQRWAGWPRT